MPQAQDSPLLQLPEVALEQIFSFLTFDDIARNRIVCRKFNEIGGKLLTRGFMQLEKRNAFIYRKVKQALPRRESERKNHPLAKYCDVLQSVETRMSMLNMTYMRYIENQLVCFIPGKVLDETKRILDLVVNNKVPPKSSQFLQELRDLSSMAIEHFDEHILPGCREQLEQHTGVLYRRLSATTSSKDRSRILLQQPVPGALSGELRKLKRIAKSHKLHITYLTQTAQRLCSKLRKQNIKLRVQASKLREQERKLQQQTAKISEQDAALTDIKKHIDEWEQKYKDFTTELIRARDDILHKAGPMLSPPMPCSSSSQSPPFRSNIKPRTAAVLPKNYLGLDLERKRKSTINLDVPLKRNRSSSVPSPPKLRVQDVSLNIPDLGSFKEKSSRSGEPEGGTDPPTGEEGELSSFLDGLLSGNRQMKRKRKMIEEIDLK